MKQKVLGATLVLSAPVNSFASYSSKEDGIDFSKINDLGTLGSIEISTLEGFKTIAKFKKDDSNEVNNILEKVKEIKDSDLVLYNNTVKDAKDINKFGEVKLDKEGKKIETTFADVTKDADVKAGKYFFIKRKDSEDSGKIKIEFKVIKKDSKFNDKLEVVEKS